MVHRTFFSLAFVWSTLAYAAPTVQITPNVTSPQPVGTIVGLSSFATDKAKGTMVYRYSVSEDGGPFRIVRDFSQAADFAWRPALYEHDARVKVTARNNDTKQTADAELPFRVASRVTAGQPLATPTANPLVALFSAPACPQGQRFQVVFQRVGDPGQPFHTSPEPCRGTRSSNVYIAGMRPDSTYQMHTEGGPAVAFHTGLLDGRFPPVSQVVPQGAATSSERLIVYGSFGFSNFVATDLDGNVVWYLTLPADESLINRMLPGGGVLMETSGANSANDMKRQQVLREVDLAGNVLSETNISRVAEQLESRGIASSCKKGAQQCVSGFHHEAIRLANGHTLAIAGLERMFPAGTQGSKGPVDIMGDLVIDLDPDLQVAWVWNSFDYLDVKRKSQSDEKCKGGAGGGGCPPVFLADEANGWLHSNSLDYDRRDGNLIVSIPEQDWVIKIDYQDGHGSGKVLWKLGQDGDFKFLSDDPHPWFSYQHDVGFDPPGSDTISLLDDGHERKKLDKNANNRVQLWKLDERAHTAALVANPDLGVYSFAVGSAQRLANGDLHALAGFVPGDHGRSCRSIEVTPQGQVVFSQELEGAGSYRSFRVVDLYTPKEK